MYQIKHYIVFIIYYFDASVYKCIEPEQTTTATTTTGKVSFNIPPKIYFLWYKSNRNENFSEFREREIMEFQNKRKAQKKRKKNHPEIYAKTFTYLAYYSIHTLTRMAFPFEAFFNTRFIILIFLTEWWCCWCHCDCLLLLFFLFTC